MSLDIIFEFVYIVKQLLHDIVASLTRKFTNDIISHAVLIRKIKGHRLHRPLDQKNY